MTLFLLNFWQELTPNLHTFNYTTMLIFPLSTVFPLRNPSLHPPVHFIISLAVLHLVPLQLFANLLLQKEEILTWGMSVTVGCHSVMSQKVMILLPQWSPSVYSAFQTHWQIRGASVRYTGHKHKAKYAVFCISANFLPRPNHAKRLHSIAGVLGAILTVLTVHHPKYV